MAVLVLISGISKHDYGMEEFNKSCLYDKLKDRYSSVIEIRYQHIMDKDAHWFKTFGDPFRLLWSDNGHKAQEHVNRELKRIAESNVTVDVLTHSLGSWMVMKVPTRVNKLINIANPLSWIGLFGGWLVRKDIGEVKLGANMTYYINSYTDAVSCWHPRKDPITPIKYIRAPWKFHPMDAYLKFICEPGVFSTIFG